MSNVVNCPETVEDMSNFSVSLQIFLFIFRPFVSKQLSLTDRLAKRQVSFCRVGFFLLVWTSLKCQILAREGKHSEVSLFFLVVGSTP